MGLLLSSAALGFVQGPAAYLFSLVVCVLLCLVCIGLMMMVARTVAD
jgi:hypothetical protein